MVLTPCCSQAVKKFKNLKTRLFLLAVVLFTGAACSTLVPVTTATPSLQPTATFTPTLIPSPTSTPTSTPSPNWTPLPTLLPAEAAAQLRGWFEGSPDCLFPCWAGMVPGKTTWGEAKQILSATVNIVTISENDTCYFGKCSWIYWENRPEKDINGYVSVRSDDLIYWVIINSDQLIPQYRIAKILTDYGPPERVFITTTTFVDDPFLPFKVTLAYPKRSLIVRYSWFANISNDKIVGCGNNGPIAISIGHDDGSAWTDDSIKNITYAGRDVAAVAFLRLEDVSNMSINDFYETFKSNSGACIPVALK